MSDVFSRLFSESVQAKKPKIQEMKEKANQQQEEAWMRRLASQCLLVDNVEGSSTIDSVEKSSLDVSTLHRKRPRTSRRQMRESVLSASSRRPVTVIMSKDGEVRDTNYYVITDSVEPIQYQSLKPSAIKHDPYNDPNIPEILINQRIGRVARSSSRIRSSRVDYRVSKTMLGPIIEPNVGSATPRKINTVVDMTEPVHAGAVPKSLPPVSATVRFWNTCGIPTSLSSISGVM